MWLERSHSLWEKCVIYGVTKGQTRRSGWAHTRLWTRLSSFSSFVSRYLSTGGELQLFSLGPIHLLPQEDVNVTWQLTFIALSPPQMSCFSFSITKEGLGQTPFGITFMRNHWIPRVKWLPRSGQEGMGKTGRGWCKGTNQSYKVSEIHNTVNTAPYAVLSRSVMSDSLWPLGL